MPETTRDGYEFGGWYTDNGQYHNRVNNGHKANGDMVLFAKWTPVEYALTFESNGGSATNQMQITFGQIYNLAEPAREYYYFGGWFIDNGTFLNEFSLESNYSSVTVYAKWIDYYGTAYYDWNPIEEDGINTFVLGVPTPEDYNHEDLQFNTIEESYEWEATPSPDFNQDGDALVIITIYNEVDQVDGYTEGDEFIGESYLQLHITE